VFRREPTQRDFDMILKALLPGGDAAWQSKLRASYFRTPVVTAERFEALIQLLTVFSGYLADFAERQMVALSDADPPAVASAKRFVQEHAEEPISLSQVVSHVGVSRFHFCRLFKRATGMTLTDYVIQVRLEKAKALLADHSLRISEVVYSSGFGSIPRFNSAFKQHLGVSPSSYRESLRPPAPA
jgi:AraC-like DNA-binding protein